jgi:hypothetical protein
MLKAAAFLVAGLTLGFVLASLNGSGDDPPGPTAAAFAAATGSADRTVAPRLAALEQALIDERRARELLTRQLTELEASLRAIQPADFAAENGSGNGLERAPSDAPGIPVPEAIRSRFALGERRFDDSNLIESLVEAGLATDRAQWIVDRSNQLRMEALQSRYDAQRDGVAPGLRAAVNLNDTLRSELGDSDYEKYLTAMGQSTRVGVGSVLASSPAEQAGLQPGDQVVAYGGQRVYNMNDLTELTFEGQPGEAVVVNIERDGQPMQIYLPRGPIGITGGAGFRRRR